MDSGFRRELGNKTFKDWIYSKHYIDSAIKKEYAVLSSRGKKYLKGRARWNKPRLKRGFVRVKEMLYSYHNGVVNVSVRPYNESIGIDLKDALFWDRVKGFGAWGAHTQAGHAHING